jgi:hypothetical protein
MESIHQESHSSETVPIKNLNTTPQSARTSPIGVQTRINLDSDTDDEVFFKLYNLKYIEYYLLGGYLYNLYGQTPNRAVCNIEMQT